LASDANPFQTLPTRTVNPFDAFTVVRVSAGRIDGSFVNIHNLVEASEFSSDAIDDIAAENTTANNKPISPCGGTS